MTERTQRLLVILATSLLTVGIGIALRQARESGVLGLTNTSSPQMNARFSVRFHQVSVNGYEQGQLAWVLTAPVIDTERDRRTMRFTDGLTATILDHGKPGAILHSPSASFTDQTHLNFTGGLEATLLKSGQNRVRLTTPTASYNTQTKAFMATGAILITVKPPVKAEQGELPTSLGTLTIHCSQLRYEVGTKTVVCTGPVFVTTEKGDEVWGNDLTLNTETRDLRFAHVRGRIRGDKDEREIL